MEQKALQITFNNLLLTIPYIMRPAKDGKATLLYVHGIGCSKHDFENAFTSPVLDGYGIVAFDFPGCGGSPYPAGAHFGIDDLAVIVHEVLQNLGLGKVVLVGHSIGGAITLRYIQKFPETVLGYINVVGNMNANDCFMTRDIAEGRQTKDTLRAKFSGSSNPGFKAYAHSLGSVDPQAYADYAASTVEHCDRGDLLDTFAGVEAPKLFIYCEDSKESIDYLGILKDRGVPLASVPNSDHFPNDDNPVEYYGIIASFLAGNNL